MAEDSGPERQHQDERAGEVGDGGAKQVDEDWKAEVRREREKLDDETSPEAGGGKPRKLPEAHFLQFVSGIAAQALMQLGQIENPFRGKKVVDLDAARYSIDIIEILQQKTRGNLTPEEERYLSAALYDLRMRYVEAASGSTPPAGDPGAAPSG